MAQTIDSTPFPSEAQSATINGHTDGDVDMTESSAPHTNQAAFTMNAETMNNTQRPDHSPMSEADTLLPQAPLDHQTPFQPVQETPLQPITNGTIAPAPTPNPAAQSQSYQPAIPNMDPSTSAASILPPMTSNPQFPTIKPDPTLSRSGTPQAQPPTQTNGTAINGSGNGIGSTNSGVSAGHVIHSIHPHGSPTRVYLNSRVTPVVLEGMKYLAKHEPERPLAWLAEFLARRSRELEGSEKDS